MALEMVPTSANVLKIDIPKGLPSCNVEQGLHFSGNG